VEPQDRPSPLHVNVYDGAVVAMAGAATGSSTHARASLSQRVETGRATRPWQHVSLAARALLISSVSDGVE
jgi:hypothetical protein